MGNKKIYYTRKSLAEAKEKLALLEKEERPDLVEKMRRARAKGDLKENAEYHAVREALGFMDIRIGHLRREIAEAQIIDESNIDTSKVSIFTNVKIKNQATGKTIAYKIVSAQEANIKQGKISMESPVAKGLLGKKKGETATIRIPAGAITFEVLDISVAK